MLDSATQRLKHWFLVMVVMTLCGCASPLKQPPIQGTIRKPYKEAALKVHDYYLNGNHFSGSTVRFQPPTAVHAFSNLRQIDFVLSEGQRKTWTHDTLVSLIKNRGQDTEVRVEVLSIRKEVTFFGTTHSRRVAETERQRLDEVLHLFTE